MRFWLLSVLQFQILVACIVTAIAVRVVPVARPPIPHVSSLQCKRTCNSSTADLMQIHCCLRVLACVKLLAMLTLDEDMLQSNMLQSNVLQTNMLQYKGYNQTRYNQTRYDQTCYNQTCYNQTSYNQTCHNQICWSGSTLLAMLTNDCKAILLFFSKSAHVTAMHISLSEEMRDCKLFSNARSLTTTLL